MNAQYVNRQNKYQDPDNFDHTAYLQLPTGKFINLGTPNSTSCPLILEDTPKTLWTLSPRSQTNKITIFTIFESLDSEGKKTTEIFSLDIWDPKNPRLMGWKMSGGDNQVFRWSLDDNNNYVISHPLTPNNIGLNNLPNLVIQTVDPDMIPIEGYMQLHNSSYKNLYINLGSSVYNQRELKIDSTPEVKWKIIFLKRLYNEADIVQKYIVKITTGEHCLDIYDPKQPQLKAWRANKHSNQEFILEKMDNLFLIHHSVSTTNVGLNKFPELFVKMEQ